MKNFAPSTYRACLTKVQLQSKLNDASKDSTVLLMALNDVLNGKIKWFKRGGYSVGISRELSPCGGLVIIRSESYASAHYFDEWYSSMRDSTPCDNDGMNLRNLAIAAHGHLLTTQAQADKDADLTLATNKI